MAKQTKEKIRETLEDREAEYGDFAEQGTMSQALLELFKMYANWEELNGFQREALQMIFHKLARIGCGNPHNQDTWHDIAGYALLVEERI